MSLRGVTDLVTTWQSRGSAHANKVAFQQIATAPNVHAELVIVSKKVNANMAPRNDIEYKLQAIDYLFYKKQSFDMLYYAVLTSSLLPPTCHLLPRGNK